MTSSTDPGPPGIWLRRGLDLGGGVDALADRLGGPIPVDVLLDDLRRRVRPAALPRLLGRAVDRAWAWDLADQADRRWWPQGVASSGGATPDGLVAGRRVLATTWYAKPVHGVHQGVRLTFHDLDTRRYEHVLLVRPVVGQDGSTRLAPVRAHAGGLVWAADWLHVAATARGFLSARIDDLMAVPSAAAPAAFGYRYVLPVRRTHRAGAADGVEPLRYSFFSVGPEERTTVLVGEYGRAGQSTRLARFALDGDGQPSYDADGLTRPISLRDAGVRRMQGAALVDGVLHVTSSNGPWRSGAVHVGDPERLASLRRYPRAVPMGIEDLAWWPATGRLWSVTEHPHRRWVISMPPSRFD